MSKTEEVLKVNICQRCKHKLGPEMPVRWQEEKEDGQTVWRIWCALCVEDMSVGYNIDWDKFTGFCCENCGGLATREYAVKFGWILEPGGDGVFCSWCAMILQGELDDPLPLSCLPKTQETTSPTGNPRRIPLWLQGTVLMTLFVSIGLNWLFLALLLALVYLAMGIWKRLERTKTPNLPPRKREEPK